MTYAYQELGIDDLPGEIWKDVVDYEGRYQVSSLGRVKSLPKYNRAERILKQKVFSRFGHVAVCLTLDKQERTIHIARLVLDAFEGPCPPTCEACHNDSVPNNNAWNNLRWGTRSSNWNDRRERGLGLNGEKNPKSKLNEENVADIKRRLIAGEAVKALASDYNVSLNNIYDIRKGKIWGNVYA